MHPEMLACVHRTMLQCIYRPDPQYVLLTTNPVLQAPGTMAIASRMAHDMSTQLLIPTVVVEIHILNIKTDTCNTTRIAN